MFVDCKIALLCGINGPYHQCWVNYFLKVIWVWVQLLG